ncbi:type II toxin-antitoxin system RelE/ParE family toxin [Cellvibrio sp. OA-2007]|uniref:type II toxin-antitoxin system RelE/ParE family toxin n=1 Tax=Cellvibrio sp. OA-2007 TaxID=529823 RepID=UPI0007862B10|nr:type II toxin-antitoxin system RelE/ParE family toxin [Cellvibrio sp. OA-2007]|tara:strand:+ start:239 stop:535 length:297 start_codon:yes stop_codon:yes gene_type:complete
MKYRVTPRARDDLKSIGLYTQQKWGRLQRNKYLKQLEQRFEWLAENPLLGRNRSDIGAGFYSFPQAEHVVFYRCGLEVIEIIGVLHQEMDVMHYFSEY